MFNHFTKLCVRTSLIVAMMATAAWAQETALPRKDIAGASDSPALKRYEGSLILSHLHQKFTDFTFPLSPLVDTGEKTEQSYMEIFKPKQKQTVEGELSRLIYLTPEGRSTLEVTRNYQDEIAAKGGKVLYSCKGEECGGSADLSARVPTGGNEDTSLMMYFIDESKLQAKFDDALGCSALPYKIDDQRFFAASFPQGGADAYATVHTYRIAKSFTDGCARYTDRTIALVNVVEPEKREQKMVTVNAREMATALDTSGRVALYGIFFDTDRTDIKPESDAALAEIANMMKSNQDLNVLVVGHTDDVGNFDYNVDLSKRRAASVTRTLADRYGIAIGRLRSFGAGMSAPTASNATEENRSKNRRVELVKMR